MKIIGIGAPELAIIVAIALALAFGYFAQQFGVKKGYGQGICFAAGLFLGFVGLIVVLLLPDKNEAKESNVDALLGYKQLLDSGAITQEEFDAKKKELL